MKCCWEPGMDRSARGRAADEGLTRLALAAGSYYPARRRPSSILKTASDVNPKPHFDKTRKHEDLFKTEEQNMSERNKHYYSILNNNLPGKGDDDTLLKDIELYQFANNQEPYQESYQEVESRKRMLNAAKDHNVPVYIITSGDPDDQWVALNIMGYRHLIKGVYGIGSTNGLSKYECIEKIMKLEKKDCDDSKTLGYLYDDMDYNRINNEMCRSIVFEKVDSKDIIGNYRNNIFVENISRFIKEGRTDCTCMDHRTFDKLTEKIKKGEVEILFFDWDCTFQSHKGQFPFHKIYESQKQPNHPEYLKQITIIRKPKQMETLPVLDVPNVSDYTESDITGSEKNKGRIRIGKHNQPTFKKSLLPLMIAASVAGVGDSEHSNPPLSFDYPSDAPSSAQIVSDKFYERLNKQRPPKGYSGLSFDQQLNKHFGIVDDSSAGLDLSFDQQLRNLPISKPKSKPAPEPPTFDEIIKQFKQEQFKQEQQNKQKKLKQELNQKQTRRKKLTKKKSKKKN